MAEPRVLSPGELPGRSGRVRVAGRVIHADDSGVTVGDALGSVRVVLSPPRPSVGALVVVEAQVTWGELSEARVIWQRPCPEPRGDGDVGRYLFQGIGLNLAARGRALGWIRQYFSGAGFIEIDPPQLLSTPGLDQHVAAVAFAEGWLSTSPEFQLKRLLTGGLPRLYSLAHVARGEEAGPQHEREFTLLEWYRAFAELDDVIADTEAVVEGVVREVRDTSTIQLSGTRLLDVRGPYERLTVRAAFKTYAGIADAVDLAESDEDRYFTHWVDDVEPGLAKLDRPIIIWEFPARHASLARRSDSDPSVARRFELFVGGVELCNGFDELTCPVEQRQRFEGDRERRRQKGLPVYELDERFLGALVEGMPPAAGNALGVDRLLALALGEREIERVMPFPRHWL